MIIIIIMRKVIIYYYYILLQMGAQCCPAISPYQFAEYKKQQSTDQEIKVLSFDDLYLISEDDYEIVGNWKATKNKMDMTGKGIIIKKQSYYYEGDIKRGEANGQGHIFWDNYAKDTYDGQFKNNEPHGKGKLTNNSSTIEGKWDNGMLNKGQIKINNEKYIIQILKHLKDNKKYIDVILPDEWRYTGYVRQNENAYVFDGQGTMKYQDSSEYRGEWKNSKKHGCGVYKKDELKYDGNYEQDQKHGEGKLYILRNKYLHGNWQKGKKNGEFKIYENEKCIGCCHFENDIKIPQQRYTY